VALRLLYALPDTIPTFRLCPASSDDVPPFWRSWPVVREHSCFCLPRMAGRSGYSQTSAMSDKPGEVESLLLLHMPTTRHLGDAHPHVKLASTSYRRVYLGNGQTSNIRQHRLKPTMIASWYQAVVPHVNSGVPTLRAVYRYEPFLGTPAPSVSRRRPSAAAEP